MNPTHFRSIRLLPLALLLAACSAAVPAPESRRATDYDSLVAHLRGAGLRVEDGGRIEQPFFTPPARVIRVGESGEAQIYEYASESAAADDAARVNRDGSIGTSMPMWIAPPHFFRSGSLLVIYLGSDETTLAVLRSALGTPFAER